jgi:hypothetical protein
VENRQVKIAAVMTAARYENTYCRNYIELGLKPLGIPLNVSGGVYYGQCMQKMLTDLCQSDCEYVVTVDGDSLFTAQQLHRLLSIVAQEKDIDACCAMQVRRGMPVLLGSSGNGTINHQWDGSPIKIATGHFGLTVIDLTKLRTTPKPWFVAVPNEDGDWEGNKVDDDVHFWLQWAKAGNSLYLDPGTRIGHMEEMVAIYDEQLKPAHMYPADWLSDASKISTQLD